MTPIPAVSVQEKIVYIRPTGQRRIQRVSPCMPGRNIQNKAVGMLNSEQYWKICRAAHVLGDVRSHQSQCLNARIRKRCKLERRAAFADGFSRMLLMLFIRWFFKSISGPLSRLSRATLWKVSSRTWTFH